MNQEIDIEMFCCIEPQLQFLAKLLLLKKVHSVVERGPLKENLPNLIAPDVDDDDQEN